MDTTAPATICTGIPNGVGAVHKLADSLRFSVELAGITAQEIELDDFDWVSVTVHGGKPLQNKGFRGGQSPKTLDTGTTRPSKRYF